MLNKLKNELNEHKRAYDNINEEYLKDIIQVADIIKKALENGKKLLIFGNGGSAADAQHFAAELSGRYKCERNGLSAIALSTDTSALTAIGNDYGYEYVFSRQVNAIAKSEDIVFGISTSGTSKNVILALEEARKIGCKCVLLASEKLENSPYFALKAPSKDTPRIQEIHIFTIHCICEILDNYFKDK
ncbi:D-sedoheptulose-7-phosphate isomerase [Campylobacter sp. RM12647]|uniref:D-sedoheptulose-7-phosphate isomerase n=1 Tax=Campylobacter sp. RM12647 TaxID=2735737 RepID=UPI001E102105|nr:D-sedoheptulose 7-phosphate isomerase [Campylobacter sp. RM12647]